MDSALPQWCWSNGGSLDPQQRGALVIIGSEYSKKLLLILNAFCSSLLPGSHPGSTRLKDAGIVIFHSQRVMEVQRGPDMDWKARTPVGDTAHMGESNNVDNPAKSSILHENKRILC